MVLASQFRLDLGDVPGWLAAGSLILAFVIFGQDRRNRSRRFVDAIGVWATATYTRRAPDSTQPDVVVTTNVSARNSADVPVRIVQLACELRTRWLVEDPRTSEQRLQSWTPADGIEQPSKFFYERFTVAPGETWSQERDQNVDHMRPPGALQLDLSQGARCDIAWVLVIDNAGRRWEIRPGRSGRARRIHPWTNRREYQPINWDVGP